MLPDLATIASRIALLGLAGAPVVFDDLAHRLSKLLMASGLGGAGGLGGVLLVELAPRPWVGWLSGYVGVATLVFTQLDPPWGDALVVPFVEDDSRVLVAGDWHGATPWAVTVLERAADLEVGTVVQLGDLGIWMPGRGRRMAEEVDAAGRRTGVRLVFIDGNHDPHARLRLMPVRPDGTAQVGQYTFYAPRGARLSWAGRTLGVLGGGFSVDRAHRTEGQDLWADLEEITDGDVARLGADPVDVLLTHEAPAGVELRASLRVDELASCRADRQRALVRQAVDATGPQLLFHGHWHHRHTSTLVADGGGSTTVVGLSEEYSVGNWVVLDLFDLDVREPPGLL